MPHRGPRIEGVEPAVGQPVERHRGRPRRHHAEQNPQPVARPDHPPPPALPPPPPPPGPCAARTAPSKANGNANRVWLNRIIPSRSRPRPQSLAAIEGLTRWV